MKAKIFLIVIFVLFLPITHTHSSQKDSDIYNKEEWKLIKSVETKSFGSQGYIYLLKANQATQKSGADVPLYLMNLIITLDGKTAYRFQTEEMDNNSKQSKNCESCYISDDIELKDVTNDGHPEVIFQSGGAGASTSSAHVHILKFNKKKKEFKDIGHSDFITGQGTFGFEWFKKGKETYGLVANSIYPGDGKPGSCHHCDKFYKYRIFKWNDKKNQFVLLKSVNSEKQYNWGAKATKEGVNFVLKHL